MKSQYIKDATRSEHHLFVETHTTEDLFLDMAGINRTLFSCLNDRVTIADREALSFCLRHLFYHTHQIYTLFLPEMTACIAESAQIETEHAQILTMPMRNMPLKNVNVQYRLWSLLQEIETTLSQMALLCQLVISAATHVIADLDRSCSIPGSVQQKRVYERERTQQSKQGERRRDGASSADWQLELAQTVRKTAQWLQHNQVRLSFSLQFAILQPMIPALTQIDDGLDSLLRSVYAIFANILPTCLQSPIRADEQITTLLLDISQRCDQILLQIGVVGEPLHLLIAQYTLETMLQ